MLSAAISMLFLIAAPAADGALCVVMAVKTRWRRFPALVALITLDMVASGILAAIDKYSTSLIYTYAYLVFALASFFAQLFVLYEVAKDVLKPRGFWNRLALKPLGLRFGAGLALALVASLLVPPDRLKPMELWLMRGDIFTSLVICGAGVALFAYADRLGLSWRSHAIAIGGGLMFWSLFAAAAEGFETYLDPQRSFDAAIGYIRSLDYILVVGFWCVSLWRNEPALRPISPALQKYVLALHERVHYDLGQAGH